MKLTTLLVLALPAFAACATTRPETAPRPAHTIEEVRRAAYDRALRCWSQPAATSFEQIEWRILDTPLIATGRQGEGMKARAAWQPDARVLWVAAPYAAHRRTLEHEMLHVVSGIMEHTHPIFARCDLRMS